MHCHERLLASSTSRWTCCLSDVLDFEKIDDDHYDDDVILSVASTDDDCVNITGRRFIFVPRFPTLPRHLKLHVICQRLTSAVMNI